MITWTQWGEETLLICVIAHDLQQLSNAFWATGNTVMYGKLIEYGSQLLSAQENIDNAVSSEINDMWK